MIGRGLAWWCQSAAQLMLRPGAVCSLTPGACSSSFPLLERKKLPLVWERTHEVSLANKLVLTLLKEMLYLTCCFYSLLQKKKKC